MLKQYPFYIKSTVILLGLALFVLAIFTLRDILIPVSFALLLAILLNPVVNLLERWKLPRIWSIVISVILCMVVIGFILYFLTTQIAGFADEFPVLEKRFSEMLLQLKHTVNEHFGIAIKKQNQAIRDFQLQLKPLFGRALGGIFGALGVLFLVPVYIFLFLFYKNLLLNFMYELFEEENSKDVGVVLRQTKTAISNYMVGLLLEALIVASLNVTALLLLGIKYAVLLGVMGALLNVLPYIGGVIAALLPMVMAMVTKNSVDGPLSVMAAYLVIQFTDNHFIMPYVVSSKVKINALISIIAVLMAGAVWGVPGMFLSIPFVGVLKIIFDRMPELKAWGKLLGDEVPTVHKGMRWNFRKKKTLDTKNEAA